MGLRQQLDCLSSWVIGQTVKSVASSTLSTAAAALLTRAQDDGNALVQVTHGLQVVCIIKDMTCMYGMPTS